MNLPEMQKAAEILGCSVGEAISRYRGRAPSRADAAYQHVRDEDECPEYLRPLIDYKAMGELMVSADLVKMLELEDGNFLVFDAPK